MKTRAPKRGGRVWLAGEIADAACLRGSARGEEFTQQLSGTVEKPRFPDTGRPLRCAVPREVIASAKALDELAGFSYCSNLIASQHSRSELRG